MASSKCPSCNGKGWICDTTYVRSGETVPCGWCYRTGLNDNVIARKLKPYVKPKPKA
jgi:hypothetical protein